MFSGLQGEMSCKHLWVCSTEEKSGPEKKYFTVCNMFFSTRYLFFQNANIINIVEKRKKKKSLELFPKLPFKLPGDFILKKTSSQAYTL